MNAIDFALKVYLHWKSFIRNISKHYKYGISRDSLVLDIGSGNQPFFRTNVACEKYPYDSSERGGTFLNIVPTVVGDAQRLPFKDKAFDFVVASHVLEHVPYPELMVAELQRVAKAGYIETPSRIAETIMGKCFHRWIVEDKDNKLIFSEEHFSDEQRDIWPKIYEFANKSIPFQYFMLKNEATLSTKYLFMNEIAFEVNRHESLGNLNIVKSTPQSKLPQNINSFMSKKQKMKKLFLKLFLSITSKKRFNKTEDLFSLLQCPLCQKGDVNYVDSNKQSLKCSYCDETFPIISGMPWLDVDIRQ